MSLLSPGLPPGPLDVVVVFSESVADRVLHHSGACPEVASWALGGGVVVPFEARLVDVLSGDPVRFCGCVVANLSTPQLRRLEDAANLAVLVEDVGSFDVSVPEPWLPLLRLGLLVDGLEARFCSQYSGEDLASASPVFSGLRSRLELLRLEALSLHPWGERLRRQVRSEVLSSRHGLLSSGTREGLSSALSALDRVSSRNLYGDEDLERLSGQQALWVDPVGAEAAARSALRPRGGALHVDELGLPRLASALVESAVERSFRAASRLAEYVVVVHSWRDDVLSDSPLAPLLAEALLRSERCALPGAVGLRLPGALGHLLWEANRREGSYSVGNVHGSLTFFKSDGVVEDLSGWVRTLEVAYVLWQDAGGEVEVPAPRDPLGSLRSGSADPSASWSAALAALA